MTRTVSKAAAGYALVLLCLANAANYGQRMVVSILLPAIKLDVGLSDAQIGLLMGGGFAIFYAVGGVPLSRSADRNGRVRWLSVAMIFWSAATALFGMARTFLEMAGARVALGAAQSLCIPTSHSLLGDFVSPERRPFALGAHSAGGVLGATLSVVLGRYLATRIGWREVLSLFGFAGMALAAITWLTLAEPARTGDRQERDRAHLPLLEAVRHLAALRSYVLVLVAACFAMLVEYGLNQWLPSYYVRQFDLPVEEVGLRYGLVVAVGGVPGSLLGGVLVAVLARRNERWLVWFPACMYLAAIPAGLGMLLASSASAALALNACYAFAIYSTNGPPLGGLLRARAPGTSRNDERADLAGDRCGRPGGRPGGGRAVERCLDRALWTRLAAAGPGGGGVPGALRRRVVAVGGAVRRPGASGAPRM